MNKTQEELNRKLSDVTRQLLEEVSDYNGEFKGAYSIRENGKCISRLSSENISLEPKTDKPGLDITIKPGTKGETCYIPACVTVGGMDDIVYNDFYIGRDADVVIVAGCGVHNDEDSESRHNGIHRFFVGENAHIRYEEKHVGTGKEDTRRDISPVTELTLEKNSYVEMNTVQIGGVTNSNRKTTATCAEGAKLVIRERLYTEKDQRAETFFQVDLNGEGSGADIVSRSVARDQSYQNFDSIVVGNAACTGHSECDAIIDGDAIVDASPRLYARNKEASLIHEAAIGKIAGEQILKFMTLGLTQEEAESKIIEGFLA